jgi:Xaa-Pro aminopeptidase
MTALDKVRTAIPSSVEAFLVTDELNVRYLSGVNYTDGFLLITREKAWLFADSRYIEVAKRDAHEGFEVVLLNKKRTEHINEAWPGITRIAYEDNSVTCAQLSAYLKGLENAEFVPAGAIVEKIRNVKTEVEKENVIKAQRIAEKAFDHVLGLITPEITEIDLALELEYYMRKNGADGIAFDTIAVSGSASSMPHGVPRNVKLQKGFLTMDFGAKFNGYCSDMTRTVCIGAPDSEMKKVYDTVLSAQMAALEYIAAGKKCADADKIARDIIAAAGYGQCFGHSLGHGVGLYIHEPISLSPRSNGVLETGNIVTVEPGIYLEGRFGVRIEDMVCVTDSGNENLTKAKKELIVL